MGVGDFGEEGDFCGEEAIVHTTENNRVNPQKTAEQERVKLQNSQIEGKKSVSTPYSGNGIPNISPEVCDEAPPVTTPPCTWAVRS